MSPWWRENIIARLAADTVTLCRRSRGPRRRELERQTLTAPGSDASTWQNIVAAMGAHLEARKWRNANLCVMLRGSLVRYLVLPWIDRLSDSDALAYAQQSFVKLHGAAAESWAVCVNEPVRGMPRVAAAVDRELIAALRAQARGLRLNLSSVQPELCAAVRELARIDSRLTGWLAVIEAGHSCIARFSEGECMTVRTARFGESAELHLLTQLEQDALCAGIESASGKFYVHAGSPLDQSALRRHGWRTLPLPGRDIT